MVKWQYAISRLLVQNVPLDDKAATKACDTEMLNNMNGMGDQGWELCATDTASFEEKIMVVQFWKRRRTEFTP